MNKKQEKLLKKNNIPREELSITTKVWNSDQGYNNTLTAFKESLNKLGLNYLDLYLIHWPAPGFDQYIETYKALEKLYYENKIKAIGVCNFNIEHLKRILKECNVKPVLNQVECHPYFQQKELKKFCERHDIFIEAYSPLMNGQEILNDVVIKKIAKYHNKTSAQVILRWHIQSKSIVIPKSVTPSRIEENINIFDFELNKSEMTKIEALDKNYRINDNPLEMNKK